MTIVLVGIHITVCVFLIFVVLLQSAQAADLAGAFGGGGSQTALGMRGATTLLQKATTGAAVIFMITSLSLGMTDRSESSLIEGLEGAAPVEAAAPDADAATTTDQEADGSSTAGESADSTGTGEEGSGSGSDEQGSQEQ